MPYSEDHKRETRARIVEAARKLFNRRGFSEVSIDEIMAEAGLTRGGFYNHFKTKDELYTEALDAFACRNPTENWNGAKVDFSQSGAELARQMVNGYVSGAHLANVEKRCPLIALPLDVVRAGPAARAAYQRLFESMVKVFAAQSAESKRASSRQQGLAIAATCVGAMILASTVDDKKLSEELCDAARVFVFDATGWDQPLAKAS